MTTCASRGFGRAWLLLAALAFSACSSFEREWRDAHTHRGTARDPFVGVWEGRWTSARHGTPAHQEGGRLRCIFTAVDATHYNAHFKANWMAFSSAYRVTFQTQRHGSELRFRGEQNLGALVGGIYRYEGRVTADRFTSSYDSSYDTGRFELQRPTIPRRQ